MMPLPCTDPHLGERVVGDARSTEPASAARLSGHLAACAACRVALERRHRAARTWSQLEPTSAEIAAARVRVAGPRESRRGALVLRGMIAAAVVLAGTAA